MGLKIKKTGASDYGQFIKALICGEPGSGKTLISSTFPNPFYASAEGGLMSIADRGIPYADVKDSDTLLEVKRLLDLDEDERATKLGFPVDTVVVDTIDEVQNILIRERLDSQRKEAMQLQDWGWLGEQMKAVIRGFRNLPMNVVFTCHIKEVNDSDSGSVWYKPMMSGQIGEALPGYVDLSLVLESQVQTKVEDGKTEQVEVRRLLTQPSRKYPFIKDRSGKLPDEFDVDFDSDYERIHESIYGNVELEEGDTVEIDVPGAPQVEPAKKKAPAKKKKAAAKKEAPAKKQAAAKEPKVVDGDGDGYKGTTEEEVDGKSLKRFKYVVDGKDVLTRNQLPEGVLPRKGDYKGTEDGEGENIYCTDCGAEINMEQAELSKIKHRTIYCVDDFEKHNR